MQPNRNAIIEAEPIKPINECPTCGQPSKTMNKRRKDILAYFDTKSMHSKTGRATKRGYFEGFCTELHTKSQENRPFEQIWCEVPSFRG
ncbi:transposase [Corynebacterium diphtheriae]|nr:transposase [Corynebacterium diphtheriae]CAB0711795.1 transposase [Corynebacterium diphtheriae]CAB0712358.1 transposase [Corynebacterium diphtheriae]